MKRSLIVTAAVFFLLRYDALSVEISNYHTLYSFTGSPSSGYYAKGNVTVDGSTLYGMTDGGGSSGLGTIFKIGTDGSGFSLLHSFVGGAADGKQPSASLTLVGSTLYGMAAGGSYAGPSYSDGVAFRIGTDGNGFSLLHTFTGGSDGKYPGGNLTLNGSAFYGMTRAGGNKNMGVIFKMGMDGNSFNTLRSFDLSDGVAPFGSLTYNDSFLYGMTCFGNNNGNTGGTVFKMHPDGTGFSVLHSFNHDTENSPYAGLTLVGSTLYGMTTEVGLNHPSGVIFKVDTDGRNYSVLHTFTGGTDDGFVPHGNLTLVGTELYGTTYAGGSANKGTIFKIGVDGGGYQIVHSFLGGSDGRNPEADLTLNGFLLYGMTGGGGTNDCGTIFAMSVPEPSTLALLGMGAFGFLAWAWRRNR